jgi:hypothetical protein
MPANHISLRKLSRTGHCETGRGIQIYGWIIFAICLLGFCQGCSQFDLPTTLPAKNIRLAQQLCVYSDFQLGSEHRLLTDATKRKSDLEAALGVELGDELIHVYLFDNAANFHRYAQQHLPNFAERRAVFLKSDTKLMVLAHWHDGLGEDLRHELIHGYLHAEFTWLPLWLDEGLAEYFELAPGSSTVHQRHVSHLAKAFRDGYWQPNLERLEAFTESSNFGETQYAESWLWIHFLLNSSSERSEVLRSYVRQLKTVPEKRPDLHSLLDTQQSQLEIAIVEHLRELAQTASEGRATGSTSIAPQ